jgi:phosphatidylserine/phosphatidylglycerophosphate/cardiolipin synthase-like enzyme
MGFIGSFNFTPRSFFYNEESGIFFHDEEMVRELNLIFADCKRNYKKLSKDNYLKFDWWSRTKAWLGKHMGEWI